MTIKELREFLVSEENKWTPEVEKYLGKFEDQLILLPHFTSDNPPVFKGWDGNNHIWMDITGMGYLFDVKHD